VTQAAVTVVDHVRTHELIHLLDGDHDSAFFATVGKVMPDYKEPKRRLRALGPTLDR
jgi:predicted metal-dependent hydrolase